MYEYPRITTVPGAGELPVSVRDWTPQPGVERPDPGNTTPQQQFIATACELGPGDFTSEEKERIRDALVKIIALGGVYNP